MRILTWNIRATQTEAQIAHLTARTDVDVLILTEYRQLVRDDQLRGALASAGWIHQHTHVQTPGPRGALIASRHPITPLPLDTVPSLAPLAGPLASSVAAARLPGHDLTLVGVYVPYADGPDKEMVWAALNAFARDHARERFLVAGDVNSCVPGETEGTRIYTPAPLETMLAATVDAWAAAAARRGLPDQDRYTWYSNKGGAALGHPA